MRTPTFANCICIRLWSLVAVTLALALPVDLLAGTITYLPITSDATSGVSSTKTYTHAIDYGDSGAALVNGVQFTQQSTIGAMPGPNGSQTLGTGSVNLPNTLGGGGSPIPVAAGGALNLLSDFMYNAPTTNIQLTGLTPGREYDFRLYDRQWATNAANSIRTQQFRFDGDGNGVFEDIIASLDEDNAQNVPPGMAAQDTANAISYRYLAGASGILNVQIQQLGNGTYHLYGLTNELIAVPEPASILCWSILGIGGMGLVLVRRSKLRLFS